MDNETRAELDSLKARLLVKDTEIDTLTTELKLVQEHKQMEAQLSGDATQQLLSINKNKDLSWWVKRLMSKVIIRTQVNLEKTIWQKTAKWTTADGKEITQTWDVNRQDMTHTANLVIRVVGLLSLIVTLVLNGTPEVLNAVVKIINFWLSAGA